MQPLSLTIDASRNSALNADNVTLLRSLNVLQGVDYTVNLSFLRSGAAYAPNIGAFAFDLRQAGATNNLVSIPTVSSGVSGWSFDLDLTSPTISAALGSSKKLDMRGLISWSEGANLQLIEPFGVSIYNSYSGLAGVSAYVSHLNGLSGDVTLTGAGNVLVSQAGNVITIFATGGGGTTGDYALTSSLNATGSLLAGQITALNAATGGYYLSSNPRGFISATGNPSITGKFFGDGSHLTGIGGGGTWGSIGGTLTGQADLNRALNSKGLSLIYTTGTPTAGHFTTDNVNVLSLTTFTCNSDLAGNGLNAIIASLPFNTSVYIKTVTDSTPESLIAQVTATSPTSLNLSIDAVSDNWNFIEGHVYSIDFYPAVSVNVVGIVKNNGGGVLSAAVPGVDYLPGGVQHVLKTDTFTTSSAYPTWVDIDGLSITYSLANAANKVLLLANLNVGDDGPGVVFLRLVRDSTSLAVGDAGSGQTLAAGNSYVNTNPNSNSNTIILQDSPGDTSSHVYTVQICVGSGGTGYVNRSATDGASITYARTVSTLTLMEVNP